jgi:hydrogenase maturation protease
MPRSVVAGFGNELRGDDGFGVVVVRHLERCNGLPAHTVLLEVGTGGLALTQELLTPCDRLVVVDAMQRGGAPGTLYVLRVEDVPAARDVDLHLAVPARALGVARTLGVMPREVFLVGCEPASVDELTMELSAPVAQAVGPAVRHVCSLLERAHE